MGTLVTKCSLTYPSDEYISKLPCGYLDASKCVVSEIHEPEGCCCSLGILMNAAHCFSYAADIGGLV